MEQGDWPPWLAQPGRFGWTKNPVPYLAKNPVPGYAKIDKKGLIRPKTLYLGMQTLLKKVWYGQKSCTPACKSCLKRSDLA